MQLFFYALGREVRGMKLDKKKMSAALIDCGKTWGQVSEETEIDRSTISMVYNGKSCRDSTAEKIAEALGVTLKDLEEEKQPAAVQEVNNG